MEEQPTLCLVFSLTLRFSGPNPPERTRVAQVGLGAPSWSSQGPVVKNPHSVQEHRRLGFAPWSGRSPGGGNGTPLQHSCLENPVARGAWQATVHGVTESDTTEVT